MDSEWWEPGGSLLEKEVIHKQEEETRITYALMDHSETSARIQIQFNIEITLDKVRISHRTLRHFQACVW